MDPSYASKYRSLEERHWWFLGRRDIIYRIIKDYDKDSKILEIGCSGGPLLKTLEKCGFRNVHGIDVDKTAIELCKTRNLINTKVADGVDTGFNSQEFDILIASDVLEHISDEDRALSEWRRILKPGGKLVVFVPAFKFLWSSHDEANYHYRRYSRDSLPGLLKKNGFKVERSSYWNFLLFFPVSAIRIFQRLIKSGNTKANGQLYKTPVFINKILEFLLFFENKLLSSGLNFPFGLSLMAISGKNEKS